MPGGQINDPSSGKHYSLPFLPATPLSPSRTLEGLFEQTQRPSKALDSPRALLPDTEIQGHSQLYGTRRGGVNLDCAFLKDALVFVVPNIVVAWAPPWTSFKTPQVEFTNCVYQWFVLFEDFDYSGDV